MSRALLACVAAAAAAAAGAPDTASKAVRGAQGQFNDAGSITGRSMATTPLVTFNAPAMGSDVPVTGTVTGLPSAATNFKVGILVSADGTIWWDKTHDYPNGVPNTNPIEGILLDANGAFTITGWVSDPNDKVAPFMRVVCVPTTFSFLWPGYQVEGVAWPLNFFNPNTVTAMTTANRQTGAVANWLPSNGAGLPALPGAGGGTAPAASPSAAAAASPSSAPAAASPSSAPAAASPSSAAAAPSNAATGSGPVVTISIPAMGTNTAVTGKVTGLPSAPTNFKIGILVSADGTIWWDKTHDYPNGSPAGTVIGIPIDATGAFTITGWVSDPHDEIAPYMRVLCVPTSFSFLWPAYQVEGVAWPLNFFNPNTVTAMVSVYRPTGAVLNWLPSNGAGLPALPSTGGGTAPAASPSAAAAASPAAASPAAASPAAAASPSSAAAAASPSAPAAPAASPSAAAAAPSTNAQPSSNALPNASPSSAPAGASGLPASGTGNSTATSGAAGSHAVSALLGGVVAAVAAGVALLA